MDALNQSPAPRRADGRRFLPPESPLSMVPCRLDRTAMPGRAPTGSTRVSTFRRLFIFLGTILLMLAGGYGMHDVVKVGGVTVLEAVLLGLPCAACLGCLLLHVRARRVFRAADAPDAWPAGRPRRPAPCCHSAHGDADADL